MVSAVRSVVILLLLAPAAGAPGRREAPRRLAVVVGCNAYGGAWSLKGAVPDAERLARALRSEDYTVFLVTDSGRDPAGRADRERYYPSKSALERMLPVWYQQAGFGPGDTVLFFFAGHGVRNPDDGNDYLVPLGARMERPWRKADLVRVSWVWEVMRRSGAGQVVLVTDACRDDSTELRGNQAEEQLAFGAAAEREVRGSGVGRGADQRGVLIRSCREGQRSYGGADGGWFTRELAEGLVGPADADHDGAVTVEELHRYVRDRVRRRAEIDGSEQVPQLTQVDERAGGIVLAGRTGRPAPLPVPDRPLVRNLRDQILFTSTRDGDEEIYRMAPDGSGLVRLTRSPGVDRCPRPSPEGTQIVFESDRSGNSDIYVMDVFGANVLRLTNDRAQDRRPEWSPNGRWIVFESDRDGQRQVYRINSDGSDLRQLTRGRQPNTEPRWWPDSSKILIESYRNGNAEAWTIDPNGSHPAQLTNHREFVCRNPAVSPDGTRIAFVRPPAAPPQVWVLELATRRLRQVSTEGAGSTPTWDPSGSRVIYTADWTLQPGRVIAKDLLTKATRDLIPAAGPGSNFDTIWTRLVN